MNNQNNFRNSKSTNNSKPKGRPNPNNMCPIHHSHKWKDCVDNRHRHNYMPRGNYNRNNNQNEQHHNTENQIEIQEESQTENENPYMKNHT